MRIRNFEVLNGKSIKEIVKLLNNQWGFDEPLNFGFLQRDNDLFLITPSVDQLDMKELNINSAGVYFAELRHDQLRLSLEGSQIIGPQAKKNVLELDDEQAQQWIRGVDVPVENVQDTGNGYVIIKSGNDFFGCGRIKEGKLLNFVPKSRRLHN